MPNSSTVHLPKRDFYRSRLRCLLLTHQPPKVVADRLNELIPSNAHVDPEEDHWLPSGFSNPEESELDKIGDFVSPEQQQALSKWWLATTARTPNWDLVSTCTIDGRKGLILLEAKAHHAELSPDGKARSSGSPNSQKNHEQVTAAIAESNTALNDVLPGFSISPDSHYQLCNRFAWSWKIASFGIPVILVYLGFLNAGDMEHLGYKPFDTDAAWQTAVRNYAKTTVPETAWEQTLNINGTPITPVIRSMDMNWLS